MHEDFPVTRMLSELERDNLLPAILFRTSRKQCDVDLVALSGMRRGSLTPDAQAVVRRELSAIMEKYQIPEEVITNHAQYTTLITTGAGAHHAGQLLAWRLVLEELMSRGVLRLMIATGTVAAGVDFPARTAVITAHSKRGSDGFKVLTASEFMQMSGRAGRRGKDAVGICLVAPGPFSDARVINEVAKRPPEPLRSAYYAAPSTVLNLLKFRNVDDLRYTVGKSLACFLDRKAGAVLRREAEERERAIKPELEGEPLKRAQKKVRRLQRDAEVLEKKQIVMLEESLTGLHRLGYVELERGGLTEKGEWAAELCTSLVLELAEAIDEHILDDLSIEQLTGVVASIAGDPHRPYFGLKANPIDKTLFKKLEEVLLRVRKSYSNPFSGDIQVLPDAALTVVTWMGCETWGEFSALLRLAGVAEGDVARLITQTADHLNQISRLVETHRELAESAIEARRRILRPPLTETIVAD